jgi:hypothetical protein
MGSDIALEPRKVNEALVFPKLSIVIPALNEAESIGHVLDEIVKVFYARVRACSTCAREVNLY